MKKILTLSILVLLVSVCLTSCGLTVKRPEIKEGEFDFSVTYEVNGVTQTISGVYVCEFDGTDWALDSGFHRSWKAYIRSDASIDGTVARIGTTEDGAHILLSFGFYPAYFMGDTEMTSLGVPEPRLTVSYPTTEDGEERFVNDAAEIESTFGAKIISYEYKSPIENTFALFK